MKEGTECIFLVDKHKTGSTEFVQALKSGSKQWKEPCGPLELLGKGEQRKLYIISGTSLHENQFSLCHKRYQPNCLGIKGN